MLDKRIKSDKLRFKEINKFLKGVEILDIGSSEGSVHNFLVNANKDKKFFTLDKGSKATFNIDLDSSMDWSKKINKKFDTIIAGEIIEHLESPIIFIRYCKKLLKKNGRLIITTPNATGLQYLVNPGWCVYYSDYRGHTQAFTLEMLKRICEDEELKVVYRNYINSFWNNNPLQLISLIIKKLRPDLIIVAEKNK